MLTMNQTILNKLCFKKELMLFPVESTARADQVVACAHAPYCN